MDEITVTSQEISSNEQIEMLQMSKFIKLGEQVVIQIFDHCLDWGKMVFDCIQAGPNTFGQRVPQF